MRLNHKTFCMYVCTYIYIFPLTGWQTIVPMECRVHLKVHHHYQRRLQHCHHQLAQKIKHHQLVHCIRRLQHHNHQLAQRVKHHQPVHYLRRHPQQPYRLRLKLKLKPLQRIVFWRPNFTSNSDSMTANKLTMILGAIIQFSFMLAVVSKKL